MFNYVQRSAFLADRTTAYYKRSRLCYTVASVCRRLCLSSVTLCIVAKPLNGASILYEKSIGTLTFVLVT